MVRTLLLHGEFIPHYRVPIYGYLGQFLNRYGYELIVASEGIQPDNPHPVEYHYIEISFSTLNITRLVRKHNIDVIILFINMRHLYLFPTYFMLKGLLHKKIVHWGQGRDLANIHSLKNLAYATEHALCDSIILYAEHLRKYVNHRFHHKVFIANNTLWAGDPARRARKPKEQILAEFGIHSTKNIICMGRLQKRKRLNHIVEALACINRTDIGLILVGPDSDGILDQFGGNNIYKLGPIYDDRKYDLLSAADVYCLPGAVGLSIIDAFHSGLPFVTDNDDESAELMYLKDGVNGFIIPKGNIQALADKLLLLLDNDQLRKRFSEEAMKEISVNGNVDKMCSGFRDALFYATSNGIHNYSAESRR